MSDRYTNEFDYLLWDLMGEIYAAQDRGIEFTSPVIKKLLEGRTVSAHDIADALNQLSPCFASGLRQFAARFNRLAGEEYILSD
jgi:hypothetical protein